MALHMIRTLEIPARRLENNIKINLKYFMRIWAIFRRFSVSSGWFYGHDNEILSKKKN